MYLKIMTEAVLSVHKSIFELFKNKKKKEYMVTGNVLFVLFSVNNMRELSDNFQ